MCLRVSYKKKKMKKLALVYIFAALKSLKKGVGSGVESVSGSNSPIRTKMSHNSDTEPTQVPSHFRKIKKLCI